MHTSRNRTRRHALLVVSLLGAWPAVSAADVVPTDGMVITEDTVFVPGVYVLPSGVSIGASGITLDMNGAVLEGVDFNNYGVQCLGFDNVTIRGGTVRNYYYGMRVEDATGVQILDNDLSLNWVDPDSLEAPAPFLNINVGPNLGDRVNLGGGLFLRDCAYALVDGNTLSGQENGIDAYFAVHGTFSNNVASNNTGWGIHLYESTQNTISNNICDNCWRPGLGDSAGLLMVYGSSDNQVVGNSLLYGGDGFFIGNEWGCPSNDNLIEGNDGSYAGANAFEATFSAGNQFINNIAEGSNYGFWLGYSHSGNLLRGNVIRANNTAGIEIEHGQHNTIEGNEIIGNGGRGIVLRTDGLVHFPPGTFPCLALPDQEHSSHYTIRDNILHSNFGLAMELTQTTDSLIVNNLFGGQFGGTVVSGGADNTWAIEPMVGENIVGGPTLGGNWWSNYTGADLDDDGIGDTEVPYTNGGQIAAPGDPYPLIGDPDLGELVNPRTLCGRRWVDQGRNTRSTGVVFDTANGAHFATDGVELYLLEGTNSTRLSRYDPLTNRYVLRANVPQSVWDGGGFQFGAGRYYATVGVQFNPGDGSGRGSYLYAYDPQLNSWAEKARTLIGGKYYANEALAYDPVAQLFYATLVSFQSGGDATALRRLAIYDPLLDQWLGFTAAGDEVINAASEAEYLDGKIYVWRGGFGGGGVNGGDSYLNVYDIATDTWSVTPTLLDAGVIPGFRSGGLDIWAPGLAADAARGKLYVLGCEANRQLYVFDVATQTWAVGPTAVYDGGWGASLEYVAGADRIYQIDGRNAYGAPQGTAMMGWGVPGDCNCDCAIDFGDINAFVLALSSPAGYAAAYPECDRLTADCNGDGVVDFRDINPFVVLLAGG